MLIAVFKPKGSADKEGTLCWGKIVQIEVTRDELAAYLEDGWIQSAAEALDAHEAEEIARLERENAQIKAQLAKPDGRTKEARAAKAAAEGDAE